MSDVALTPHAQPRLAPAAVFAAVLAGTAAAWVVLAGRMAGMDAGPGGDPGALGWFAATWAIMTAAMMLPAAAPAVVRLTRAWPTRAPATAVSFLAGYGVVWMVAGLAGYGLVVAIRGLHPAALAWSSAGRFVAAGALVAAGLYQLTAVKRRWLVRCTAPDLPLGHHRAADALRAGVRHGGCCVACCWTLMAALYALGMMSLSWMAVVTVLILGERVLRPSAAIVRVVAAVLVVLGLAVAAAPASVPGLTIPRPAAAATADPAMMGMQG
jgi:predicted metal-binding membrane protein